MIDDSNSEMIRLSDLLRIETQESARMRASRDKLGGGCCGRRGDTAPASNMGRTDTFPA